MNKKQTKTSTQTIVGASSLLAAFSILALVSFALLSLTSANSSAKQSEISRAVTSSYYEADFKAQEVISLLRYNPSSQAISRAKEELDVEVTGEGVSSGKNRYIFKIDYTDTQALNVEVLIKGSDYEIVKYMAVSTVTYDNLDDGLDVWDGTFE